MKVTRDQIQARAQELRNRKFTIRATLEMNAGARPVSSSPKNVPSGAANKENVPAPDQTSREAQELGKIA